MFGPSDGERKSSQLEYTPESMLFGFRTQNKLVDGSDIPTLGSIGIVSSDTACVAEYLLPIDQERKELAERLAEEEAAKEKEKEEKLEEKKKKFEEAEKKEKSGGSDSDSDSDDGGSGGIIALIVILALLVVCGILAFVYREKLKPKLRKLCKRGNSNPNNIVPQKTAVHPADEEDVLDNSSRPLKGVSFADEEAVEESSTMVEAKFKSIDAALVGDIARL